jgi:hypothetical protein
MSAAGSLLDHSATCAGSIKQVRDQKRAKPSKPQEN